MRAATLSAAKGAPTPGRRQARSTLQMPTDPRRSYELFEPARGLHQPAAPTDVITTEATRRRERRCLMRWTLSSRLSGLGERVAVERRTSEVGTREFAELHEGLTVGRVEK